MLRRRKSPSCHSSPHSPLPVMFTPLLCSVSIVTVETNGWFPRQGQVWSGRSTPVTAQNSVGQSSQVSTRPRPFQHFLISHHHHHTTLLLNNSHKHNLNFADNRNPPGPGRL